MRSSRHRALKLKLVLIVVLSLFAGACSSSDDASEDGTAEQSAAGSDDGGAEADEDEGDGIPQWSGAPVNPFDLRSGQCFNEVSWIDEEQQRRIEITAAVACTEPHEKEVYHEAEFPAPAGAPFPGETKMSEWSTELCYNAFEGFVGEEYELSVFGIDYLQPTQATFEHPIGRHRRVTCFLYDSLGEEKVGSARSSAR